MIAREAFWYLAPVLIVAAIVQFGFHFYALPFWLLALAIAYLFRNPVYEYSSDPLAILSPVDAVVKSISRMKDPYMDRDSVRIELEMGVLDPYILRSATEGKIANFWMRNANSEAKSTVKAIRIQTDEADEMIMEIYPSRIRQTRCYYAAGERVGQGKKCGFLPFGSKVVVYLPENSIIEIHEGEHVTAGKHIIAHWSRS